MNKFLRYSMIALLTAFSNLLFAEEPGTVPATALTVAQALEKINALDDAQQSEDMFWVTGVVTSIEEISTNYGNATFYIKDENGTDQLYIYRVKGFNNEKITDEYFIKVNDVLYIRGYLKKYVKDNTVTPEIVNGYIDSVNGVGKEVYTGEDLPVLSVADAITYTTALEADVESSDEILVKGKICSIKYEYSAQYGTATYNISEDGKEGTEFTVYGSYYFDNKAWTDGQTQIKVNDDVMVRGKVIYYKGTTPEFANKKNYLISLNGQTEPIKVEPNAPKEIGIAEALTIISGLEGGKTTNEEYLVKGIIVSIDEVSTSYGNATFNLADNANDGEEKQVKVFRAKGFDNEKITDENIIKVGDEVVVQGKLQKYVKDDVTTPEVSSCYFYSINGKGSGIGNILMENVNAPIYNLAGQRVEKATKGIYIQNGKKYVVK